MICFRGSDLSDNFVAKGNETKITLNKKGNMGMRVTKGSGKQSVNVTVSYGSTVAAKINVTKGYTESFLNN